MTPPDRDRLQQIRVLVNDGLTVNNAGTRWLLDRLDAVTEERDDLNRRMTALRTNYIDWCFDKKERDEMITFFCEALAGWKPQDPAAAGGEEQGT